MRPWLIAFALPPLVVFGVQTAVNRMLRGKSPQVLTMLSMVIGYVPFFLTVGALFSGLGRGPDFYVYMFLLYSFSAYTYFHVFNMSETSRRVRMLTLISSRGIKQVRELEGIYDEDRMIRTRLERLVALGQVKEEGGLFYPRGRAFPRAASFLYALSRLLGKPWPPMVKFEGSYLKRPGRAFLPPGEPGS